MSHESYEHLLTRVLEAWPRVFLDLVILFAYVVLMDGVLVSGTVRGGLRVLLGLPLLVFVPGYAVLAALFPRHHDGPTERAFAGVEDGALTTLERGLLSFGVSLALLPPIGLAVELVATDWEPMTILGGLNAFIFLALVVAAVRRFFAYESDDVDGQRAVWLARSLPDPSFDSRPDALLFAALVVVAVIATSTLAVALVAPGEGEAFTNVALLTENETGALATDGYPSNLTVGTSEDLVVAVENHEGRTVDYTLVGELQRVDRSNGSLSVIESSALSRQSRSVPADGTWLANVSVTPTMVGEDLRLSFVVYIGDPSGDGEARTATEPVYLWVDVAG